MILATIEGVIEETYVTLAGAAGGATVTFYVHDPALTVLRLGEEGVGKLHAALAQWLAKRPKPCPAQYPYGHRCQVAAGHDGPHRFEVTW